MKKKMVDVLGKLTSVVTSLHPEKIRSNFIQQANTQLLGKVRQNILEEVREANKRIMEERPQRLGTISSAMTEEKTGRNNNVCQKGLVKLPGDAYYETIDRLFVLEVMTRLQPMVKIMKGFLGVTKHLAGKGFKSCTNLASRTKGRTENMRKAVKLLTNLTPSLRLRNSGPKTEETKREQTRPFFTSTHIVFFRCFTQIVAQD